MKRIVPLLAALLLAAVSIHAQPTLRYNFIQKGTTHISANYESLTGGELPLDVRLDYLRFPDGSDGYLVHMLLKGKKPVQIPKGAKMIVTLRGSKTVRLEQVGDNPPNVGRFLAEPYDILQMTKNVRYLDIPTGWNPDDHIQVAFGGNELAQLIKGQFELIVASGESYIPVEGEILGISEGSISNRIVAKPIVSKGVNRIYNVGMTRLSYKEKEADDFDLSILVGTEEKYMIKYGSDITLVLRDGTQQVLSQHGDSVNRIVLYPTPQEVQEMIRKGIVSMSFMTDHGPVLETFKDNDLSRVIDQQYQLLMSIAP